MSSTIVTPSNFIRLDEFEKDYQYLDKSINCEEDIGLLIRLRSAYRELHNKKDRDLLLDTNNTLINNHYHDILKQIKAFENSRVKLLSSLQNNPTTKRFQIHSAHVLVQEKFTETLKKLQALVQGIDEFSQKEHDDKLLHCLTLTPLPAESWSEMLTKYAPIAKYASDHLTGITISAMAIAAVALGKYTGLLSSRRKQMAGAGILTLAASSAIKHVSLSWVGKKLSDARDLVLKNPSLPAAAIGIGSALCMYGKGKSLDNTLIVSGIAGAASYLGTCAAGYLSNGQATGS